MKKMFIAGMLSLALMQNSFAGTVTLTSEEAAGAPSEFRLGVVAKIKRDLQLLISNGGFADATAKGTIAKQTFAFGQEASVGSAAEDYVINPLSLSPIVEEVCGNPLAPQAFSVQKLVQGSLDKTGAPGGASCIVSSGAVKTVEATFKSKIEVKASGGLTGTVALQQINGVDVDLDTGIASADFLTSTMDLSIDDASSQPLVGVSSFIVGQGPSDVADLAVGDITYHMSFDLNGPNAKALSRVAYLHQLLAD